MSDYKTVSDEWDNPKKFIPKTIHSILSGEQIPIYTNSEGDIGSRTHLHCKEFISCIYSCFWLNNSKSYDCLFSI